jgi:hypothetical protein
MSFLRSHLACAVALVLSLGAAPASASTVEAVRGNDAVDPIRTLVKIGSRGGEASDMRISWSYGGRDHPDGIVVSDRTAPLRARGSLCKKAGTGRVRCEGMPFTIDVELGNRDDEFRIATPRGDLRPEPVVDGGGGRDVLVSGHGAFLEGGPGDDRLTSGSAEPAVQATLRGGPGQDVLRSGNGPDFLEGGPGNDVLYAGRGADRLFGSVIYHRTRSGNDRLYAGLGSDTLEDGDSGHKAGPDLLVGGRGNDRVNSYRDREKAVFVDISDTAGDGQRGENDALVGVENLIGGAGDDRLTGDGDANRINGYIGKDTIRGRGGRDTLVSYDGDHLRGDLGDDVFSTPSSGIRRVDCGRGTDRLTTGLAAPGRGAPRAGPVVPRGCEQITGRRYREALTISSHPVSVSDDGLLTFEISHFDCCQYTLSLTRPSAPFEELDSAPVDSDRVSVNGPGRPGTLRASIRHSDGASLAWRFAVGR